MKPPRQTRTDKLAETLFARACDVAGASSNPSLDDQYGWDFMFQLPAPVSLGPPDLGAAGLTGLAQIKSTLQGRRSISLKVSNALRMAQEATPCFVVAMAFENGAAEPHTVWVLHIWKEEIARVLEASRRAHLKGEALHKVRLTFSLLDDAQCDPLGIVGRIEAVLAAIGPGYAAAKAKLCSTVGYEDGYGGGTITFRVSNEDELIDHLLGRVPTLEAINIDLREERFGLPGPLMMPNEPGRIGIEAKPVEPCQLIISRDGEEMVFDGQVYVPHVPNLAPRLFKVRFQSDILEVIWRQEGPCHVEASFGGERTYPISTYLQLATLMTWLAAGDVELAVWVKHRQFIRGPLFLDVEKVNDPVWDDLRRALRDILTALPQARWPADVSFRMADLLNGVEALQMFAMRVASVAVELMLAGVAEVMATFLADMEHHVSPALLQLGGVTLYAFVAAPILGHVVTDGDVRLRLGPPTVFHRGVLAGSIEANWPTLTHAYCAFRQKHAGETTLQALLPETYENGATLTGLCS